MLLAARKHFFGPFNLLAAHLEDSKQFCLFVLELRQQVQVYVVDLPEVHLEVEIIASLELIRMKFLIK